MNCRGFEENIICYHDGELTVAQSKAMRAHLEACSTCASLYREVIATYSAFDEVTGQSIPDANSFVDDVMQNIDKKQTQSVFYMLRKSAAVAASVILIAGIAAGVIAGTSIARSGSSISSSEGDYFSSLASDFHLNTENEVSFESYLLTQDDINDNE